MSIDDWLTLITVFGLTGMGLLVCAASVGVVMAARAIKYFPLLRGKAFAWHQWSTIGIGLLILLHSLLSLTTASRTEITWINIVVPFTAAKETVWLGIGSLALYLLVFTVVSSLTIRKQHPKLWRVFHYGSYLVLVLGLVHGLFISSTFQPDWQLDFLDAEKLAVELFGVLLIFAVIFRIRLSNLYLRLRRPS